MNTYDSNQVTVSFAGRTIDTGRAEGEFVSTEFTSETFTTKAGADGEATRSKTNDRTATIKIKLMQTSAGHLLMTELHAIALASVNGSDAGAFEIRDLTGGLVERAEKCWIEKPPANPYGKEAGEREWTLKCEALIREVA